MSKLDYNPHIDKLPQPAIRISPSQLGLFFNKPHLWFRDLWLKEKYFTGSEASVLGTSVHYLIEQKIKNKIIKEQDLYEIEQYCNKQDFDLNTEQIIQDATIMSDKAYELIQNEQIIGSESFYHTKLADHIYLSGTIDLIIQHDNEVEIIDFKTTSNKTQQKSIPFDYKIQLLSYAYMLKKNGFNPTQISNIFITRPDENRISEKTGKPLKSYPCQAYKLIQQITEEDWIYIEQILFLVSETMQYFINHPNIAYLLFKDYRLKNMGFDTFKFKQKRKRFKG
jgi:hypothetical protein